MARTLAALMPAAGAFVGGWCAKPPDFLAADIYRRHRRALTAAGAKKPAGRAVTRSKADTPARTGTARHPEAHVVGIDGNDRVLAMLFGAVLRPKR